ncbi:bifunctional 5-dehydro-2-deoxygluconokinase/5-dehydro-2-deoxyphosphogluconate aldolase [Paraburkholderia saeva]|uniref:5-dehydro-2-deoxygluconokinase n=1 Tax=Paraburkholderia saeva TaxID=2777537 RepID=A0A9N8RW93_9BURK|nr:5-dehydro-2-deoxygluconokinase [Paraburkholderia saeva]CAG4887511.1 5-dehydro-2-deoxygluconokinase [Paraburkholderia saeva]CAG4895091.1 5-dehydro-2-deoxygluconokinase [Paraburkholderia saeva]CAG4897941.1 5-dehydro-2-deoxygluconokinase [Paraburkholderia saeva]
MTTTPFTASALHERPLDVICIGRLAVDLYAQQIGSRLEDATSFARYLGGSSGNIAFGTARLGLRSAMLARVGDDHMGRFLIEALEREGSDTRHIRRDADHLTGLVILGVKDRDTFPLLFYRENCADMMLSEEDVDEWFIASSKALLITGTHFSTPRVAAASHLALTHARRHRVRTVLDIDYRPVLWGLTSRADGEVRYVASAQVTDHLLRILPQFDLVIGTEEEFRIAGGADDLLTALRAVRAVSKAALVVKRGPLGCTVIEGAIPASLDDAPTFAGPRVEVLNVLGAGDAFASGFLSRWLRGANWAECARVANASGALVVSRHGCAPAMPTEAELQHFLTVSERPQTAPLRPDLDAELAHLHRVSVPRAKRDELYVFAFDHRPQFLELAREAGTSEERIPLLKQLFVEAVAQTESGRRLAGKIGVLIDGRYGTQALNAATGRGWWIGRPVELPGSSPLVFEPGRSIGSALVSWPAEHTIKCLVQYHPDAAVDERIEQESQVLALYAAARASGHELLLEVIPSKRLPCGPDTVYRALKRLYNLGIKPEWWKLEQMSAAQWQAIDALIDERDPWCRGTVMLGLNAPLEQLIDGFAQARHSHRCAGFMVGRTIFQAPSQRWLAGQLDDAGLIREVRASFETLIDAWDRAAVAGCAA